MGRIRELHRHATNKTRQFVRKFQYNAQWQQTALGIAIAVIILIGIMIYASSQFESTTHVKFYAKRCYDKMEYKTDSSSDPLENSTQQTTYAIKGKELSMTYKFIQKCHGKLNLDSEINKDVISIKIQPTGITENCLCTSLITAKASPLELPQYTIKTIKKSGDIEYLVEEKTIQTGIKIE